MNKDIKEALGSLAEALKAKDTENKNLWIACERRRYKRW